MDNFFDIQDVIVNHNFIRKDLTLIDNKYNEFIEAFYNHFLDKILSKSTFSIWKRFEINNSSITDEERELLKLSLKRIFANEQHFKGSVGEHILDFYYKFYKSNTLFFSGPKGRSSAEAGIDYIVFLGNINDLSTINFIVWETKTTDNEPTSRSGEIYDFFKSGGSFYENIDSEIKSLEEKSQYFDQSKENLKIFFENMPIYVLNGSNEFKIGACLVFKDTVTVTNNTLKKFQSSISGLSKDQRIVKFIICKSIENILLDLKDKIWNKL